MTRRATVEVFQPASTRGWLTSQAHVQVQVSLRPTVSRTVCLGDGSLSGVPSLTRGQACNLLVQFSVTLRSKSSRTHAHILMTHFKLPNPGGQVLVFISPGTGWPSYTPRYRIPFSSPLTTHKGYCGSILTHLHTGLNHNWQSQSWSSITTDS
jgi:hypothetical protein